MSATKAFPDGAGTQPNVPVRSAQVLIDLIVTLLAPMFLSAVGGDLTYARTAAAETIKSYRAETLADLIIAAKIVAFGLAALGSLGLSMEEDLPTATILRLRANAIACDRAEFRSHCALNQNHTDPNPPPAPAPDPEREPDEAPLVGAVAETPKRTADHMAPQPPATPISATPNPATSFAVSEEQQFQAAWAASAAQIAAETTADLPNLSPEQRRDAKIWIEALNAAASDILAGNMPPRPRPGDVSWMTPDGP